MDDLQVGGLAATCAASHETQGVAEAGMPKPGRIANQPGKIRAATLVALLIGRQPDSQPIRNNVCYCFVSDKVVVHVASVHRHGTEKRPRCPCPALAA